jgi:hypothetical protein
LPKSKFKDEVIDWISARKSPETTVVLVENKALTATQLKKFPDAKVMLFKLPALLFSFVDALGTERPAKLITMFHQILNSQDAEFVFVMIVRQVRMLIAFVADGAYEGPPFGRQKIQAQARAFTLERLLTLHQRLLEVDIRQKTSRNSLSLTQEIDLLLTEA